MVMYLHYIASSQSACAAEQGKHKWRPVGGTLELDSDFITNQERCTHYGKFSHCQNCLLGKAQIRNSVWKSS